MGILTIDDRDPLLSYSPAGSWGQGGVSSEYNSTTSIATATGSTATLTFSGTSVYVYGTIASLAYANGESPPQTSFVVDNGSPTKFTATFTNATQYEQRFYNSGILSAGTHTLLITLLSTNSTFYLDYIQVIPMDLTLSSSSSTTASSSSSSLSSSSIQTQFSSSTATTSPSPSPSSQDSHTPGTTNAESSSRLTTIIGGSLGALAILIVVFFAILFMRKRQRDKKFKKMLDSKVITTDSLWTRYTPRRSNSFITPFITSRYQPINDETRLDLLENRPSTTRAVPYDAAPTPPQKDSISSLRSKGFSHSPSSSQHAISIQDPRTNASAPRESTSNQASSSSRQALIPNRGFTLDRPPPQYHD